jgi:hypothetical protein
LGRLFDFLASGPVFTLENLAPELTANKPALYALLPIERPFDPLLPTVNGGVSGWDLVRDAAALAAYQLPILRACEDAAIREAISWHDQGALIWAIQSLGLQARVLPDRRWNLCVRHSAAALKPLVWGPEVWLPLREVEPEACILHCYLLAAFCSIRSSRRCISKISSSHLSS